LDVSVQILTQCPISDYVVGLKALLRGMAVLMIEVTGVEEYTDG